MNIIRTFALLLISLSTVINLYGQEKRIQPVLSHPIKFGTENYSSEPKDFFNGTDSVKIVAIMVQFQEDDDNRSTGNGRFDLSNKYFNPNTGRDTVVDAPPYDSSYFADHLMFLKNYYNKSSKGKLQVSYDLYGTVITLPNKMETYSPQRNENNAKIGNLYADAWSRADSVINFSQYQNQKTAFVIFHAGVGRDVDLTSVFGFDPTPYDIPSVYLGLKNLKEFFGNNFNGYQTSEGVLIQNSLIIPSTEIRELQLISGNFLLELGMNGILTASFGSYLGLPDLFNTSNGKTAIGRFGLMDGQSLFSYNGIFPPEPSAWEKIYLGWVNPVTISSGSRNINLPAVSKFVQRDSAIYKVLISSKEYFLLENRNRDPENDGQIIYSRNRTFVDSTTFQYDDQDGFYYSGGCASLYKINGNVRDVQTFDWSLPGLIDPSNSYRGGILIWQIDETIIDANLSTNTINNNIDRKGVDLEEAKGAQEIGVTFSTPFGNFTGDGTIVDYWFNGSHSVPSTIYRNEFTPQSIPSSLSYSLANNNIYIKNFSVIDTLMTASVSIGSTSLSPLTGFPKRMSIDTANNSQAIAFDFNGDGSDEIFANDGTNIYGFNSNGLPLRDTGVVLLGFGEYIPALFTNAGQNYIVGINSNRINFLNTAFNGQEYTLPGSSSVSAPVVSFLAEGYILIGRESGGVYKLSNNQPAERIDSLAGMINQFAKSRTSDFGAAFGNIKYAIYGALTNNSSTDLLTINSNSEIFINGNRVNIAYQIGSIESPPTLADLDSDGKQEIIFSAGGKVYAVNSSGVLIDNFPARITGEVSSGISVCDLNADSKYDLIFVTNDGDLYAYGADGKVVSNFPVKVGPGTYSTPALANFNDTLGIVVSGGDGFIYGLKTNVTYASAKVLWKNYQKDQYLTNNNFITGGNPVSFSEKLPADRVYNWPNPVYDGSTFIRYYLNGNTSSVKIKILDLSGELVTTLNGTSISNADNEVKWDVADVQSGIYYGVIEADIDGSSEKKIIKIAVVK
ncbi:MAG: T9SS type A sorting domain-containing protein [Ignavibacteria bacterium]